MGFLICLAPFSFSGLCDLQFVIFLKNLIDFFYPIEYKEIVNSNGIVYPLYDDIEKSGEIQQNRFNR